MSLARPPPEVARHIANLLRDVYHSAGTVLFQRGEAPKNGIFVVSGEVSLLGLDDEEDRVFEAGSLVGIIDLNIGRPRARTCVVTKDAHVLELPFDVLCLGHGARAIKEYFLRYDECISNDFVLSDGGKKIELLRRDTDQWRITFVDTGVNSSIGERLRQVKSHLQGEEMFLANYSDGLSDLDLDDYVRKFAARDKIACFLSVPAPHTFHIVHSGPDDLVSRLEAVSRMALIWASTMRWASA